MERNEKSTLIDYRDAVNTIFSKVVTAGMSEEKLRGNDKNRTGKFLDCRVHQERYL